MDYNLKFTIYRIYHISEKKMRIFRISTVPFFIITQLTEQIRFLESNGLKISVFCSDEEGFQELSSKFTTKKLKISRGISPLSDIIAIAMYIKALMWGAPDISHSTTPKAGLVNAISCKFTKKTLSVHTFTGQVWANHRGFPRYFLFFIDWLVFQLTDYVLCDSVSQKKYLISQGFRGKEMFVLGSGSLAGVDIMRFSAERIQESKSDIRQKLGFSDKDKIGIFVGRVNMDKGVDRLLDLYCQPNLSTMGHKLILIGPIEDNRLEKKIATVKNVRHFGFTDQPEVYLKAADFFLLLSRREGFGTSVIEAQAMGLPVLLSKIYGLQDCFCEGKTGYSVNPDNLAQCVYHVENIIQNRSALSMAAMEFAKERFDCRLLNKHQLEFYNTIYKQNFN